MKSITTIGMDMGDKKHNICVLDSCGEVCKRTTVSNTARGLKNYFSKMDPCCVAVEAGTHSGWVSRLLENLGHQVLVGNPRKLRVIWDRDWKDDDRDAEMLARIARFDPRLLYPIHHRGEEAHADLAVLKARDALVKARASLITHVRGSVKAIGARISPCSAASFHKRLDAELPELLKAALEGVIPILENLTLQIRQYDRQIESLCSEKYPETLNLQGIAGVGPITALGFVLTLEEAERFEQSRSVGAYLGLTPKRSQSGSMDKQLGITKAGDAYMRRLLVGSAQYILGPFGPECDLKAFGMRLASRGGKNAKRRAVVAVARKLAVLLHSLWKSGATYDPMYQSARKRPKAA